MSDIQEQIKIAHKRAEENDNKFRVIDLLNKIANKEKLPKKIKIRGIYYRDYNEEIDEWIDKEDIKKWKSPHTKVKGEVLLKVLKTFKDHHNCKFIFVPKKDMGKKIIELLGGKNE